MHIKSLLQLDHQVDISSISQRLPRSVTLGNQPVWHHYDVLLVPRAPWLPRFWKINLTSLDNMQISVVLHISFSILRRLPRIKLFFLRIYIKLKWRQIIGMMKPRMNNKHYTFPSKTRSHPSERTSFYSCSRCLWQLYPSKSHKTFDVYFRFLHTSLFHLKKSECRALTCCWCLRYIVLLPRGCTFIEL